MLSSIGTYSASSFCHHHPLISNRRRGLPPTSVDQFDIPIRDGREAIGAIVIAERDSRVYRAVKISFAIVRSIGRLFANSLLRRTLCKTDATARCIEGTRDSGAARSRTG